MILYAILAGLFFTLISLLDIIIPSTTMKIKKAENRILFQAKTQSLFLIRIFLIGTILIIPTFTFLISIAETEILKNVFKFVLIVSAISGISNSHMFWRNYIRIKNEILIRENQITTE